MNFEEYKNIMGLNSVDMGSRQALIKLCRPFVKRKSGLYKLSKKQLYKIYETYHKIHKMEVLERENNWNK